MSVSKYEAITMIADAIVAAGYDHGNEDNNLAKDGEVYTVEEAWAAILTTLRGPLGGWTFDPWTDDNVLFARMGTEHLVVGRIHTTGWIAWLPKEWAGFAHGHEMGEAGRNAVVAALRSKGAKL